MRRGKEVRKKAAATPTTPRMQPALTALRQKTSHEKVLEGKFIAAARHEQATPLVLYPITKATPGGKQVYTHRWHPQKAAPTNMDTEKNVGNTDKPAAAANSITPATATSIACQTSSSSESFSPYGSQPWPWWTKYVALMTGFEAGSSSQYSGLTVRSCTQPQPQQPRSAWGTKGECMQNNIGFLKFATTQPLTVRVHEMQHTPGKCPGGWRARSGKQRNTV